MSVRQIQQALKAAGFDPGPIDGIKGPKTLAAIRAFQKARGLVVDGIVGPKTTAALRGSGGSSAPAQPALDINAMQEQYGTMASLINSDPELKNLFNQAVAGGWSPDRFQVMLRNTNWYKTHGEAWRNAVTQQQVDPATYASRVSQVRTAIGMQAAELGAVASGATLDALATEAYQLGLDENQIRQRLSSYVSLTGGHFLGQAEQNAVELRQYAANMGVDLADDTITNYVKNVAGGQMSLDTALANIRETSISAFPNLAERLRAGETVADIADPYVQAQARLLELPSSAINLKDPMVRQALSGPQGPDGKPTLKPLYQFEKEVRQDPRWTKTSNARESLTTVTEGILKDWGLIS